MRRTVSLLLALLAVCILVGITAGVFFTLFAQPEAAQVAPPSPSAPASTPTPAPTPTPEPTPPPVVYLDLDPADPIYEAAQYVGRSGLLPARDQALEPDALVTRREALAALDLPEEGDDAPLTRAELARLLYGCRPDRDTDLYIALENYPDQDRVADGDRDALSWALAGGLFDGLVTDALSPSLPVTRGQLVPVLTAFRAAQGDEEALALLPAGPSRPAPTPIQASHDNIQALVEQVAQEYSVRGGIQVAVIEGGRVTDAFAAGVANRSQLEIHNVNTGADYLIDSNAPMTPDHKLRIASISKVVLAMGAMSLAEDGVVDLDESIGTYWGCDVSSPWYPDLPISIDTILTHTSSLLMTGSDTTYGHDAVQTRISTRNSGNKPGDMSAWGYNNYAFEVLGLTLELASGELVDDFMAQRFFTPLDIDAAYRPVNLAHPELLATVYEYDGSVGLSVRTFQSFGRDVTEPGQLAGVFCGGLAIGARDLAKLVAVLANDGVYEGVRFLSEESVRHMETPLGTAPDGFRQCYPLRYREDMYGRPGLYYHTGSSYGVYNCMSYDPATGDGVVVLTSGARGVRDAYGVYAVCGTISEYIYGLMAQ